jgi:hypothetical protein
MRAKTGRQVQQPVPHDTERSKPFQETLTARLLVMLAMVVACVLFKALFQLLVPFSTLHVVLTMAPFLWSVVITGIWGIGGIPRLSIALWSTAILVEAGSIGVQMAVCGVAAASPNLSNAIPILATSCPPIGGSAKASIVVNLGGTLVFTVVVWVLLIFDAVKAGRRNRVLQRVAHRFDTVFYQCSALQQGQAAHQLIDCIQQLGGAFLKLRVTTDTVDVSKSNRNPHALVDAAGAIGMPAIEHPLLQPDGLTHRKRPWGSAFLGFSPSELLVSIA